MSLTLENLRIVTALVHAAPRAEMRLTRDDGRRLIVSSHPAADIEIAEMPDGAVTAALKPDPGLGVTVVSTAVEASWPDHVGAEVATAALLACLVEELVIDTHNSRQCRPENPGSVRARSDTHRAIRSDRIDRRPTA